MVYSEPGKQASDLRGFQQQRNQFCSVCSIIFPYCGLYRVLGPEELTFSSEHIFGDRTARSSMQETKRKLNKISTDVLLAPKRLGNTVAITPICASDRKERAGHEEQTSLLSPAASSCTAASIRACGHHLHVRGLPAGR